MGVHTHEDDGCVAVADVEAVVNNGAIDDESIASASAGTRAALLAVAGVATAALAACGLDNPGNPQNTKAREYGAASGNTDRPAAADPANAPSKIDAARFLTQATFGITSPEQVDALQTQGYAQWLWDQTRAPSMLHSSYLDWQRMRNRADYRVDEAMSYEAIWQHWLHGEDQLRARTAFALSQIIVVSNTAPDLPPAAMSSWMDMLTRHAFGTYRALLQSVSLHTAMGYYLNMQGNAKADPSKGMHPNENYAREVLQLFSIGLVQLNLDGTPKLDAQGRTIATFDEAVVKGYSRAFTGWTTVGAKSFVEFEESDPNNWREPMVPVPQYHETGTKQLLDGQVLAAGGTPESDLAAALDSIANHPNVAPFITRQLIQRFVTSNPSPAYVARVATVFNDNGAGLRGDLGAVVRAVLLDAEARTPGIHAQGPLQGRFGKLREPVIRYANLLRGLGAKSQDGSNRIHALNNGDQSLGQSPLLAPSVFNFYSPNFRPAGEMATKGLVGPEFQITTEATLVSSLNTMVDLVEHGGHGWGDGRLELDTTAWREAAASPTGLIDRIDTVFFTKQMLPSTRERMTALVQSVPAGDAAKRVRLALTLTIVSPDFVVQV
jgi:uncharacterized protein (DUF1800 family)